MESNENIHLLILRLFSGETDATEKNTISDWLSQSAENTKLYYDLKEIWLSAGVQVNADHYHLEDAIRKFREKINGPKVQQKNNFSLIIFLKYAAIVILFLGLPISYYFGTQNSTAQQSMTTITCAFGDKSTVTLPDSSKVWLNSGSKLTFNSDFKREGRKVILEGEAYFSVSKDKKNPFRVKTTGIDIEVLGTEFNLKAYPDDKLVSTTLVEGSLQISSNHQNTIIKPNQKLVFDKKTGTMKLKELADTSNDTDWKEGRLIFRNESLEELKPKLERWFDVDIVFDDEIVKRRRFTGVLERESILEVVSYFDLSNHITCKIQGNKVIIKSKNK
jgi:transmembrane sensor